MFNKVYSKILTFIKQNIGFIIFIVIFNFIITFPLPYYIHTTGGIMDVSGKVTVKNEYKIKGSYNLAYVTEIKGNVITCLLSYIMPHWKLVPVEEENYENETYEEVAYRNKIMLDDANQNAVFYAYKKANKEVNIESVRHFIIYIDEKAKTDLKISDEILTVNGNSIKDQNDYINIVQNLNIGDKLHITVKTKDNKIINKSIIVYENNDKKITGIYFITKYTYTTNPKISIHFKKSESGPSGGLMTTLAIYNKLIRDDNTKGKTIVGTGTIDINGNVGEISGIEYKLRGAVKAKADIFFAPSGDNYKEAIAQKKKYAYNIKIISISTFDDALNYLKNM